MPSLRIKRTWTDHDGMVQLEVSASNGAQTGTQDFYTYPEELLEFARSLEQFPRSLKDEVKLEYGEDPQFYNYLLFRVFVLDSAGHSALEIKLDNRLTAPLRAESHFYLQSEPADINKLGRALGSWTSNMADPFSFEWTYI